MRFPFLFALDLKSEIKRFKNVLNTLIGKTVGTGSIKKLVERYYRVGIRIKSIKRLIQNSSISTALILRFLDEISLCVGRKIGRVRLREAY